MLCLVVWCDYNSSLSLSLALPERERGREGGRESTTTTGDLLAESQFAQLPTSRLFVLVPPYIDYTPCVLYYTKTSQQFSHDNMKTSHDNRYFNENPL